MMLSFCHCDKCHFIKSQISLTAKQCFGLIMIPTYICVSVAVHVDDIAPDDDCVDNDFIIIIK